MLRYLPHRAALCACALAAIWIVAGDAHAQDCACTQTLPLGTNSADGSALGLKPGDVLCIEAGSRPFLSLDGIEGTESAPVLIKNCGGQVVIDNSDKGYGIRIGTSKFFRLSGTGDAGVPYGFDIAARRTGPDYSAMGVAVGDLSTDYELDHLHVHHAGFAGFNLKTEPRCDGSANLGTFVQENTRVHDTWVHDTGGEAFYVGSTGYGGRDYQCNGQTVTLYPHEHEGVYLYDNLIEDTGWDGLQVGVTPKDCEVYRNVIRRVGRTATDMVQTRGIQIGGASACEIRDNYLEDGPTIGIFILGAGRTVLTNNVVVGFAEDGIYANDQQNDAIQGVPYVFLHNTVIGSGENGITLFGERLQGSLGFNNLIVGSVGQPLAIGGTVDWQEGGNLAFDDLSPAGFVDAAGGDYHLIASSPARDTAVPIPGYNPTADRDGVSRDAKPDVGAYEYSDTPPPDGGVSGSGGAAGSGGAGSGGAGSGASGGDSGIAGGGTAGSGAGSAGAVPAAGASDASGCACTTRERGSHGGWRWTLVVAAAWLVRRKAD